MQVLKNSLLQPGIAIKQGNFDLPTIELKYLKNCMLLLYIYLLLFRSQNIRFTGEYGNDKKKALRKILPKRMEEKLADKKELAEYRKKYGRW